MPIRIKTSELDLEAANEEIERQVRQITVSLDQAIASGTPVDTGHLRANWLMDFGAINARTTNSLTAPNTGRGNAWKVGDGNIFIHNTVEYAVVIDAGRSFRDGQLRGSDFAPQGILDPAIAAVNARFG